MGGRLCKNWTDIFDNFCQFLHANVVKTLLVAWRFCKIFHVARKFYMVFSCKITEFSIFPNKYPCMHQCKMQNFIANPTRVPYKKKLMINDDILDNHFMSCLPIMHLTDQFAGNYFSISNFIFLIKSEVLKFSRSTTRICYQKLVVCFSGKRLGRVVQTSPILDQWRSCILKSRFHTVCYLPLSSKKWASFAFIPILSLFYCQNS